MGLKELLLHDLEPSQAEGRLPAPGPEITVFPALPKVRHCLGCFGCWVKTPGRCVIDDRGSDFAALMAKHDRLTVVSRLVFGGLSGPVKAVIDRSIGFILPFFETRDGQTYHTRRYPKSPILRYFFHGPAFGTNLETAKKVAEANWRNFMAPEISVRHLPSLDELPAALSLNSSDPAGDPWER
ncbi:MAG: flavodoxin family protein [Deltaproteobacteria bacterium]|jgi:hypothetical protein|nr:flavodoxin family protein [Deltaproteobacteria bacterium]